jgi:hypothetical protein
MGTVHCLQAFTPALLAQGTDAIVINTASVAGLFNAR